MVSTAFRLRKWYVDCVPPDGRVFIGYWARATWHGISVGLGSAIADDGTGRHRERSTLRPGPAPTLQHGVLTWNCDRLGLNAVWKAQTPTAHRRLLSTPAGVVDWTCHMPRAAAEVRATGGPPLTGFGYAEFLDMTMAPWDLPIHELRWGRYLSAAEAITWIQWLGPEPRALVLRAGQEQADAEISDDLIAWTGGQLVLACDTRRVLRDGDVGSALLAALPGIARVFPPASIRVHETKWLSRARIAGSANDDGWAIHERVIFEGPQR